MNIYSVATPTERRLLDTDNSDGAIRTVAENILKSPDRRSRLSDEQLATVTAWSVLGLRIQ